MIHSNHVYSEREHDVSINQAGGAPAIQARELAVPSRSWDTRDLRGALVVLFISLLALAWLWLLRDVRAGLPGAATTPTPAATATGTGASVAAPGD